jgi:hypothetical protein
MKKKKFSKDLLSQKISVPIHQTENEGAFGRRRKSTGPQKDLDNQNIDETTFWENFQAYLLNSTLHGLKYIGTVGLSAIERYIFFSHIYMMSLTSF